MIIPHEQLVMGDICVFHGSYEIKENYQLWSTISFDHYDMVAMFLTKDDVKFWFYTPNFGIMWTFSGHVNVVTRLEESLC